jgi:hypothetical protein
VLKSSAIKIVPIELWLNLDTRRSARESKRNRHGALAKSSMDYIRWSVARGPVTQKAPNSDGIAETEEGY